MSEEITELTQDNLPNFDIKTLALNKEKFGEITFDKSLPYLEQLRDIFKEFEELQYSTKLLPDLVIQANTRRDRLIELIKRLQSFRLAEGFNKDTRDGFENEVESLYQEVFRNDLQWLTFLKQDAASESSDTKKLHDEHKTVAKIKKEYEQIIDELKKQKTDLEKQTLEVEKAQVEKAAVTFGKHFELQAKEYGSKARGFESQRKVLFRWFLVIIVGNIVAFLYLFITFKLNRSPHLDPDNFFTLQYAIFKIALLGLLSWAMGFASRNYHINRNLEAVNNHRKNVAETLRDFVKGSSSPEERIQIIKIGADAMFKNIPSGYIGKEISSKDGGPIEHIINNFISGKP